MKADPITGFWGIERGYLASPASHEQFKKDVLTGTTINSFEYEDPFNFIPSYGATTSLNFNNNFIQFGDGYSSLSSQGLNNVSMQMNLPFYEREASEIEQIIEHVEKHIGSPFPFQTVKYDDLEPNEKYKALYSVPPYFQQEFQCEGIERNYSRGEYQNVDLVFGNKNISLFSKDYIFAIPSMPTNFYDKIKAEIKKDTFEHIPDQSLNETSLFRVKKFGSTKSRPFAGKERINDKTLTYDLLFDPIDLEKMTLILAFMMSKAGTWFYFSPDGKESSRKKFICNEISQSYTYNNVFSVRCRIAETISF